LRLKSGFDVEGLERIGADQLTVISKCLDDVVQWAMDAMSTTSDDILRWLRSPRDKEPWTWPFRAPQEKSTRKRYKQSWKELIFYTLRTALLDEDVRRRHYGIEFTDRQIEIIGELMALLKEYRVDEEGEERSAEVDDDSESYRHTWATWIRLYMID
jgi:hypothetical protein